MKRCRTAIPVLLSLTLGACGQPVPPDKSPYVGEWTSPQMALLITQDGEVRYARKQNGVSKTMKAPLKGFDGDNFLVGVGPVTSTFSVGVAPHRDGDEWKMTVDGVELTRKR